MIESDTIKLLRECDAGLRMGVAAIDEVLPATPSRELRQTLRRCRAEHRSLHGELQTRLQRFGDKGKAPNPMALGMSKLKSRVKLTFDRSDAAVASLMSDGCSMGVKSLNRYLNQYRAADEFSKDVAKRLIHQEEQLRAQIRRFL